MANPATTQNTDSLLENIIEGIFTDKNQVNNQSLSIIGLLYQVGFNVAIGAGAFLVFVLLRPNNARVYARRYKALKDSRRPPKIGKGLFAWAPILWRVDEKYMIENVDLDSVFFLRFLKLGIILMGIFGVLGMCVIVPLNYHNGNNSNVTGNLKQFILLWLTLYHITQLNVFWLHVGAAYLFTAIVFFFIWREYNHYIRVKQEYFASPAYQRKLQSRTVMLTRVPPDMQADERLHSFMSNRCPAVVPTQASIARKLGQLPKLIEDHERLVRKLEAVLYKYLAGNFQQKQRPQIKVNGAMVDAIEHYTVEIEELENTINRVRQENESFTPTSVGFVSYATPQMAHDAMRSLKSVSPALASLSPHPKDIIWSNAQMPRSVRVARLWTARLFSVLFCFIAFWPVAALTFIGDATNIQVIWKDTKKFFDAHDTLTTIWQTTFSPLILALYYIAIPHVFRAISRYQGISTHTGVERSVLKKMYVFYFLSNILVFTLVGLIVRAVLRHSTLSQVMSTLAHDFVQTLNQKAQFWTAYVSLKGMNAMLEFAQLISLTMIFIKRYTRDLTPRELRDLTKPPDFDYSPVYSLYLWVFTISMFYSVYTPIALPFAFLDFLLAYWVYKYAILYVYQTKHDTAGAMWRNVINRMIISMVIFQVYLIGCLKARISEFVDRPGEMKGSQPIVYALVPLPVLTCIAGVALHKWLNPKVNYMEHSVESESFNAQKTAAEDQSSEESLGDRFLHPMFSQPLTTPVVDKRVRHLLPKVYRGRTSVFIDPKAAAIAVSYNQDSLETKVGSSTFTSALSGTDILDTESMMDARDRRDFDGTSTPVPMYPGMSRRLSVDSSTTNGDDVELLHLSGKSSRRLSPSSSQAELLGNTQTLESSSPDLSDNEMGSVVELGNMPNSSSASNLSDLGGGGGVGARRQNRDTFDPIDLYGDSDEKAGLYGQNEKGMASMLTQTTAGLGAPRYNTGPRAPPQLNARPPYPRPGPGPGPRPGPRPGMTMARPNPGGPPPPHQQQMQMQMQMQRPTGPPQGYPVRGGQQPQRPMMRPSGSRPPFSSQQGPMMYSERPPQQQPQVSRYGPPPGQIRPGMMGRPMARPQVRPDNAPPGAYGPRGGQPPMRPGMRPNSRPPPPPGPNSGPPERSRNIPRWD